MEFRFDLSSLFRQPIVKINNSMLPSGFAGDRRTAFIDEDEKKRWYKEATAKVAEIINEIGETSAQSQGLSVPVTNSSKLRSSDHVIYLLNEKNDKRGIVTGFLKVGKKSLYLFNEQGKTVYVNALCLLDFWIHESRQRQGWGRKLFQYMLQEEQLMPQEVAYDRPSNKLMNFLAKHYGLYNKIQQLNNFVIFDGFFDNKNDLENVDRRMRITASPNTNLFGPQFVKDDDATSTSSHQPLQIRRPHQTTSTSHQSFNPLSPSLIQATPLGRYAAPKPTCSMGQIIHNSPAAVATEPNSANERYYHEYLTHGSPEYPEHDDVLSDKVAALELQSQQQHQQQSPASRTPLASPARTVPQHLTFADQRSSNGHSTTNNGHSPVSPGGGGNNNSLNKMHTGMKNISTNVGLAVSPSTRMEFEQEQNEGFGSIKINRPIRKSMERQSETDSIISDGSRLTDQGHVDLKFYHNRLW